MFYPKRWKEKDNGGKALPRTLKHRYPNLEFVSLYTNYIYSTLMKRICLPNYNLTSFESVLEIYIYINVTLNPNYIKRRDKMSSDQIL